MVGDGNSTNAGGRQNPPATNVFLHVKLRSALRNRVLSKCTKSTPIRELFQKPLDGIRDRAVDATTIFTPHPPASAGTLLKPGNFEGLRERALQVNRTV